MRDHIAPWRSECLRRVSGTHTFWLDQEGNELQTPARRSRIRRPSIRRVHEAHHAGAKGEEAAEVCRRRFGQMNSADL